MALIPSQYDNLKVAGLQHAAISLFSNVARNIQITNGSSGAGWANTVSSMHHIVTADNIRVLNLDKIQSTQFLANAIISQPDVQHVDQTKLESSTTNLPTNINSANGLIVAAAVVHVPEKTFPTSNSSNVQALNNYLHSTLNQNATFAQANVVSTLDYALKYGHLTQWTNLTSKDFDLSTHTDQVQNIYENGHTLLQTAASGYLP